MLGVWCMWDEVYVYNFQKWLGILHDETTGEFIV